MDIFRVLNIFLMPFCVFAITGVFYVLGRGFIRLLGLDERFGVGVAISSGMVLAAVPGWYAYRSGMSMGPFYFLLILAVVVVLMVLLTMSDKRGIALPKYSLGSISAFMIFVLVFCLQILIFSGSLRFLVGTLGNNDIFHYSLLAEPLLGNPGYGNVIVNGAPVPAHPIDVFGVFFSLGFMAYVLARSALESTSVFLVFCMSVLCVSIYDVLRKMFGFKYFVSICISLMVVSGSMMFYIAYNHFYAQLMATVFFISSLDIMLEFDGADGKKRPFREAMLLILPFAGILLVFQAGVLVFFSGAALFWTVRTLISRKYAYYYYIPAALLFSIILLPELAIYTIERTLVVKDSLDGWILPLIFPAYLFSFPAIRSFPGYAGRVWHYAVAFVIAAPVFVSGYLASKRVAVRYSESILSLGLTVFMFGAGYLAAYMIKGGTYQVWKFASFTLLPMSFVFWGCMLLACRRICSSAYSWRVVQALLAASVLFAVIIAPLKQIFLPLADTLEALKYIERQFKDETIEYLVLDTGPYDETMIAYNILSPRFKLFPLDVSYGNWHPESSFLRNICPEKALVIVSAQSMKRLSAPVSRSDYRVLGLREYLKSGLHRQERHK